MAFRCISCQHPMIHSIGNSVKCENCDRSYFVVNGTPIYLNDELAYLNDNYASIQTHIANTHAHIRIGEDSFYLRPERIEYFRQLQDGFLANLELYDNLLTELAPYTNSELIAKADYLNFVNSPIKGKEINYFIRDWSGLETCELEISTIVKILRNCIANYSNSRGSIFFAGSGTGRFAFELANDFDRVYCTDLSFRMVKFFDYILKEEKFNLNILSGFSNVYHPKEVTREVEVSNQNKLTPTNITNFVSDICNIPLQDNSMEVFASIYFLDCLNVEFYIEEIYRVLKTDGIYVNIGPIGYPGGNFIHNLLPSEIKSIFERQGFLIEFEDFEEIPYMNFDHEMSTLIHKNWIFVARKTAKIKLEELKIESVLKINDTFYTERRAQISDDGENVFFNRIYFANGNTYEDADLFIEILYRIDGVNSLEDVISQINNDLDLQLSFEDIKPHIERFIANKTLKFN